MSEKLLTRNEVGQPFFRRALDSVVTNVMIADSNHDIVYLNETAKQMFRSAAEALRNELPDFDAEKLLGANIDAFHREPPRQRRILECLDDTYTTQLTVGGRTFRLIANPIFNKGARLGTVVEWSDLTVQLELADEEQQRVEAEHLRKRIVMDTIIRELHHRMKNDLQGVVGLLRQSASRDTGSIAAINDAIRQIRAVAIIYKLQGASVRVELKLEDMVAALVSSVNETTRGRLLFCSGRNEGGELHVNEEEAVPLALIINELLTNAVKHSPSSSEDARILVGLDRWNDNARLCISNPAEQMHGDLDLESGKGLGTGLNLVRSLLPEPGSQLSLDVEEGTATAVLVMKHPLIRTGSS